RPSSRLTPRRPSTPTPFPYTTLFRSQEHRADRAAQRLRDLLPLRATVVRDGERKEVDATELVPGDLVLLTAGDRISADLVLEHVAELAVDESMLTGESVPARPGPGATAYAG